jgi:hypothetical protein
MYVKAGVSFDFRLAANTRLHFVNNDTKQMEDEILNQIQKPSALFTQFQPGLGLQFGKRAKYGKPAKPLGSVEFIIPIAVAKSLGLINSASGVGIGIQFNLLLPVNKK